MFPKIGGAPRLRGVRTSTIDEQRGPGGGAVVAHPLAACLETVRSALAGVVDTPCWSLTPQQLAALLQESAGALAGLSELRLRLLAAAEASDLAVSSGATSTAAWLVHGERQSRAAAGADVRMAQALDRSCEATRRALARGEVNTAQAMAITTAVMQLPACVGDEDRARAEAWLLEQAREFGPEELRTLARRIWEVIDPDAADEREGKVLEAEEAEARRTSTLVMRRRGDGATDGRFRVPDAQADMLRTWCEAVSAPRRDHLQQDPDTAAEDDVPYLVRMGRALGVLAEHLPTDGFSAQGALPATVTIDIDYAKLRDELGAAVLSTGTRLSAGEARRLACNAGLLPIVLDGKSRILDMGMSQRLYDRYARIALGRRDGGCIWPGCDRPPAWCEAHHVVAWSEGGPTNLDNGCLLCVVHHHLAHKGEWQVVMAADGVPEVIPPPRIDLLRRPRRHARFSRSRGPD